MNIIEPVEAQLFKLPVEILIGADAWDTDGVIVQVDFFLGDQLLGSATESPYYILPTIITEGDLTLTAKAIDDAGAVTISPPVHVTFYRPPVLGQVAIVQNFAAPELALLQSELAEAQMESHVFDQEDLTLEMLAGYDLIVWNDLGDQADGLTANDVRVLQSAFDAGIPLYFIGEALVTSAQNLTEPERSQWLALLHLQPNANPPSGSVFTIAEPAHPILNGRAGGVGSFLLRGSPQVSAQATGEITVLARVGDTDALVASEDPVTGARTLTQLAPAFVEAGTHEFAQRRKLLRNAVGWLTRTTSPTAASEISLQTFVVPATAVVGSELRYVFVVAKNSAELAATDVTLIDQLPPEVKFVAASPGCSETNGLVTCRLGTLANNGDFVVVTILVSPVLPGVMWNRAQVVANEYDFATENNLSTRPTLTLLTPLLSIEALAGARYRLRLTGAVDVRHRIEASTNLLDWDTLVFTNIVNSARTGTLEIIDLSATNLPQRSYRAVALP
ncbi:MAG: hypothetical protein HYY24_05425 [Verrucomicrobia bacterium]|nr:hypothetical protein [Verrucomicrobiota bacterium]